MNWIFRNDDKDKILFLGNSIVKGDVGFNWIKALSRDFPNLQLVNKGENGSQIPGVIDIVKKGLDFHPSAIIVHIGGNDVSCSYNEIPALNTGRHGRKPTCPAIFSEEFSEMMSLLSDFHVPIAVFNLKPQGEELTSTLNERIREYNKILESLVLQFPQASLLDAYGPFAAEIMARRSALACPAPSARITDIVRPGRIVRTMLLHLLCLGWLSWNWIGEREGFVMSSDGLHCNERAGSVFRAAARTFLDERLRRTA